MLIASIHDPLSGDEIRITAHNPSALLQQVDNKIDQLRKMIVNLLWYAATEVVIIGLMTLSTIEVIPYGWLAILVIAVAYVQRAPFWLNPLARIWYLRRCMRAWRQELDRITAPDTRMGHDAL